jgi:TPR repeat protein
VLEVWEHPPGWLRGPRGLVITVLGWLREHWLSAGGLGAIAGFAGVVATLAVFWWPQRREDQRFQQEQERRDLEAETEQTRLLRAHCWVDAASGWLPRISTLIDPIALGVHPATPVAELDQAAQPPAAVAIDLPERVPVYVPRDLDARLDAALARGGLVLLRGDSTAGKSRAAYEALRRLPGDRFVLIPSERGSLRALRDAGLEFEGTVVWLNDLERFLGPGGMDTGLLHWLVGEGTPQVVVLATMRSSEYNQRDPSDEHHATGPERDLLRADRELLNQAVEDLELERRFTQEEQRRAKERAWDPRIADALKRAGRYGLAEYVAAGPRLWRRWRNASAVDSPLPERVGAALVAAAIDCRRAWLSRPVPEPILRDLLNTYLEDEPDADRLAPTVIADGLAWATTRVQATSALLSRKGDGYVVFDYLLDRVQRIPDALPVQGAVWERLLVDPQPEDAFRVGMAAYLTGQWPITGRALSVAAEAGHHDAEYNLGVLSHQQGKLEEAGQWYRRAADAGHHVAEYNLGLLLYQQGRLEEAGQWYRRAADAGDHDAEYNVGVLLYQQGKLEEAEHWWRRAADAGHHSVQNSLGFLLHQQGNPEEAEQWYRRAADAGHHFAENNLGGLLYEQGKLEEAEHWWRRAADAGDTDAASALARLLTEHQ